MSVEQIKIPDIGSDSAEVVEILVKVGDLVEVDQSLAVLESDKASVEVPCPLAGTVVSVSFSVGDKVSEGADAVEIEVSGVNSAPEEQAVAEPVAAQPVTENKPVSKNLSIAGTGVPVVCLVPDIGADEAEIIEVSVAVGDSVVEGDSIVVAESDKASLEIPAEFDGTVEALHVSQGDKVTQGIQLVTIAPAGVQIVSGDETTVAEEELPDIENVPVLQDVVTPEPVISAQTYPVPDIGSDAAEVIEVNVSVGDNIEEGDSICVVETDKASVEVPAPASGTIEALFVSTGDQIGQGNDLIRIVGQAEVSQAKPAKATETKTSEADASPALIKKPQKEASQSAQAASNVVSRTSSEVYAGPAARKHARELGVDLLQVKGTGERGRILIEDVNQFVKDRMQFGDKASSGGGGGLPEIPATDWSKFGDVSVEPMSRIHKATAANMVRNWLNVPHVTQFDNADVTELEKYRAYLKSEATSRGIKMTPLAFLLKASAVALNENPKMNSSLHHSGEDLIFRKFVHISVAVDTPAGLMVPVIRDVDKKDIWELAADVSSLAAKAKEGKLGPKDMQGASFTISSLGAIGGTGFTPIVPAPQVGILGVSKTSIQPVWDGDEFTPRKMMPLALSYDHRAVNGADAGKFMTTLVAVLEDLDRIWNG